MRGVAILVAHGFMTFPLSPVALLGVGGLMPILAALGMAGYEAGWAGMRILLGQLARWRLPQGGRWYAITLIGMALIVLLAQLLNLVLGGKWPPSPPATTWQTLPVLAVVYLIIAIIEEVGWRGYALPRLQLHYGGLAASLILGMIWGCWHLPQWFIPATGQADKWPFGVFLLHTVAFSVLLTWLYNHSAGSLWPVILAHTAFNLFPEPWAAAWQSLPVEQRGLYPVILITLVEVVIVVLLVRRIGVRLDQPQRLTVALLPALLALALGLTPSIPAAAQTTPTTPDLAAIDAYLATQMQELGIPGLALLALGPQNGIVERVSAEIK